MTILDIIFGIIFLIGLGVFIGMVLAVGAITFELTIEFCEDKLSKFKKRFKKE